MRLSLSELFIASTKKKKKKKKKTTTTMTPARNLARLPRTLGASRSAGAMARATAAAAPAALRMGQPSSRTLSAACPACISCLSTSARGMRTQAHSRINLSNTAVRPSDLRQLESAIARHRSTFSSSPFSFSASSQMRGSSLIHQQRRAYSQGTAPNQQQVFQSFGTPFVAFLLILSRIARIIVVTGLAGVTILAVGYEGTHMYVEYVAMPRAAAAAAAAAADGADEYDWSLDYIFSDHNGLGSGLTGAGTDPRLGFKARHLVRAAWIATEWGGGLSPSIFFAAAGSSSGGAGSVGGSLGSAAGAFGGAEAQAAARFALRESMRSGDASIDKGLKIAEQYLDAALNIAENKRAIPMVPDPIAIRRQGAAAAADGKELVDPTAAALEMQLASVRARIGSPQKIYQAIGGFERLYDAYSFQFQQRRAAPADTEERQRLIHLANRIGGLYAALGKRDSAEAWYMRGIDAVSPTTSASADNFASLTSSIQAPKTSPAITRSLVNSLLGLSVLYATPPSANQQQQKKKQPATARDAAPETGSLQIDAAYRAGLEKALGAEMAALKLLRLELHGLSHSVGSSSGVGKREKPQPALASLTSPDDQLRASEGDAAGTLGSPRTRQLAPASGSSKGGEDGRELYWLWLLQQDGQTSMLIAETIYALQLEKRERQEELLGAAASASGGSAGALLGALRGAFGGAGPSQVGSKGKQSSAGGVSSSSIARNAQSIAWLQEAESAAERVYAAVAADHSGSSASGKGKKGSKAPPAGSLAERWGKAPPLEVVARRLLRDSRRMEQNAGEMIGLLERST